jgi:hypothetical protein
MVTIWSQLPVPQGQTTLQLPKLTRQETRVPQASIEKSRTKQIILKTVHLLQQATAEQIVRLNWSAGYLRDIQKHISQMVKAEILEADIPPKYTRFGLAPQVFLTGRKAPKYIGSGSRPAR